MKKDELKVEAIKAAETANDSRYFNRDRQNQVNALKAIAWAIIYLADVLRYKT